MVGSDSMVVTMDDILKTAFEDRADSVSEVKVSFRKTVNTRPYETEVVEAEVVVRVPNDMAGIERILHLAIIQAQVEYEVYLNLAIKGYVTKEEFDNERKVIESTINKLVNKAIDLGKSVEHIFSVKDS